MVRFHHQITERYLASLENTTHTVTKAPNRQSRQGMRSGKWDLGRQHLTSARFPRSSSQKQEKRGSLSCCIKKKIKFFNINHVSVLRTLIHPSFKVSQVKRRYLCRHSFHELKLTLGNLAETTWISRSGRCQGKYRLSFHTAGSIPFRSQIILKSLRLTGQ